MAKKLKKKTVAPTNDAVATIPEHIRHSGKARGMENISAQDLEIPRIKLLQAITPSVMEGLHSAGSFLHTVAEIELGEVITCIPIIASKAFILWAPRHEEGGILARSDDGEHWVPSHGEFVVHPIKGSKEEAVWKLAPTVAESGLDQFGSSMPGDPNSKPAATKMYNLLVDLPDFPELSPCAISLQRSSIKLARKLMSKLAIATSKDGVDLFGLKLKITSVIETKNDDNYFNWKIELDGYNEDKESYERCEAIYKAMQTSGFKVKLDDDDTEVEVEGDGDTNGADY